MPCTQQKWLCCTYNISLQYCISLHVPYTFHAHLMAHNWLTSNEWYLRSDRIHLKATKNIPNYNDATVQFAIHSTYCWRKLEWEKSARENSYQCWLDKTRYSLWCHMYARHQQYKRPNLYGKVHTFHNKIDAILYVASLHSSVPLLLVTFWHVNVTQWRDYLKKAMGNAMLMAQSSWGIRF